MGNPGRTYAFTRHNIGFMALDELAKQKSFIFKRSVLKKSYIAVKDIAGGAVMLAKPLAYMNNSGKCVKKIIGSKKISLDDVLIVYDDVDLELGKIRFKASGGSAGHKGFTSILDILQTNKINRLRVGIGRPADRAVEISDYVLSNFDKSEKIFLKEAINKTVQHCWDWLLRKN